MNRPSNTFGCNTCWPPSADAAWETLKSLKTDIELVDESHFMIKIRSCTKCTQQFLSVFTETIDWEDGADPQYWTVIPLTPEEGERLLAEATIIEAALSALLGTRQSLRHDFPKGSEPRSYWSRGIAIGPHD